MTQPKIDWGKAWEVFWERYQREAPRMYEIQAKAGGIFKELWKRISPVMGLEETVAISLDKDGGLRTSMAGWILIGAIGAAGAIDATDKSQEALEKGLAELATKGENKVQTIEKRLEAIEKDIGIKRPPMAEEKANT